MVPGPEPHEGPVSTANGGGTGGGRGRGRGRGGRGRGAGKGGRGGRGGGSADASSGGRGRRKPRTSHRFYQARRGHPDEKDPDFSRDLSTHAPENVFNEQEQNALLAQEQVAKEQLAKELAEKEKLENERAARELKAKQDAEAAELAARDRAERVRRIRGWHLMRAEMFKQREANSAAWETGFKLPSNLDSNFKKTSTFLRKVRTFGVGESSVDSICRDAERLNLSRYVTEIVNAIVEARLSRSADVANAVRIASTIHRLYAGFAQELQPAIIHQFDEVSSSGPEIDKETAARWRSSLKLFTDLFRWGVFREFKPVMSVVKAMIDADTGEDHSYTLMSILTGFVRYAGLDFLGVCSLKHEEDVKLFLQDDSAGEKRVKLDDHDLLLAPAIQQKCLALVHKYFDTCAARLLAIHKQAEQQKKSNTRQQFYKGVVDESNESALKEICGRRDALQRQLTGLAELLRADLPELSEIVEDESPGGFVVMSDDDEKLSSSNAGALFEDDETRCFYAVFPNLRAMVPAILLEDGNEAEKKKQRDCIQQEDDESVQNALVNDEDVAQWDERASQGVSDEAVLLGTSMSPFDLFLKKLPEAMNREQIDYLAEQFCYFNNRGSRRKLVEVLYTVPWERLDLLPYYSRLVAILYSVFPDIGNELSRLLKNQFYGLMKNKKQYKLESRVRCVRFIGELVKFGVAHHSVAFNCWNFCLNDFSGDRIRVCCALMESCGRFLYRNPETSERALETLERTMKLKSAKYLDEHCTMLIDNAYYSCKPPPIQVRPQKQRPIMHKYIRYLLYEVLCESKIELVLSCLRRLPWNQASDNEGVAYAKKLLYRADRVSFENVAPLASVVAGLHRYHGIGVEVGERVLEEFRSGMMRNDYAETQRRISFARYIGQLYNYRILNAQAVFDSLYLLLTLGHTTNRAGHIVSRIDPPTDTTRVRLAAAIIHECSSFLGRGSRRRRRLHRYLVYLQRYLLLKTVVPADLDFLMDDLFDELAPTCKRYYTLSEVEAAVAELDSRTNHCDALVRLGGSPAPAPAPQATDGMDSDEDDDEDDEEFETKEEDVTTEIDEEDAHGDEEMETDLDDEKMWSRGRIGNDEDALEDSLLEEGLDRLVIESVEEHKWEKRAVKNLADSLTFASSDAGSSSSQQLGPNSHVKFRMLTRKQNKTQVKSLDIPMEVGLAASSMRDREAAIQEQLALRRMVMAGMRREEMEEQASMADWSSGLNPDRNLAESVDLSYRNYDPSLEASSERSSVFGRSNRRRGNGQGQTAWVHRSSASS